MTLCDQLEAYFKARPGEWIDGMELSRVAGCYAWRSRVSDLRKRGVKIENRQWSVHERHAPDCHAVWDGFTCKCGLPGKRTISEYRYVPADRLAVAQGEGEAQAHE